MQKQLDRIKGGGESGEESDSEISSEPNPENREEFKEPTVEFCDPDTEPEDSEILGSQKTEEYFEEESESELSQESLDSEPVKVILGSHFFLPLLHYFPIMFFKSATLLNINLTFFLYLGGSVLDNLS